MTKTAAELLGVQDLPEAGRDRLVVKAIELFYRHGFQAVGLDRVIREAGVSKTTFYKHFDSKDDLVVAAIRMRDEWERAAWDRAVRALAGDDPKARLLGAFDVMDVWFNDPQFGGCIFINAAAEFPDPNEPAHQAAAEHKKRNRDDVRDLASAAGLADPEGFADEYTLVFEGALIMRQTFGRNDAARVARAAAGRLLERAASVEGDTAGGTGGK